MKFGIFSIILLLGTLQGVILSLTLLLSGGGRRQSKCFLAAFMLVLAYNSFGTFCWSVGLDVGWVGIFDDIFPYTFIFTLGSSFYLYIESTIAGENIGTKKIVRLYLPALIDCSFRICLLLYAILYKNRATIALTPGRIDSVYQPIAMFLMVIVFWVYLIAAIVQFRKHSNQIVKQHALVSTEQKLVIKWTKVLLIVMTVVALVWAVTIFDSLLFHITGIGFFKPIEITLVIFVYWIGLRGYQLTRVVYINEQKAAKALTESLTNAEIENCLPLLIKAMEDDKQYLDPTLTLKKLSDHLNIPPRVISAVLNNALKKGFIEFVNDYRIAEVKQKMLEPGYKNLTIAGIALGCGFNSIATFQRVFKNTEKVSPKQYLAGQLEQIK